MDKRYLLWGPVYVVYQIILYFIGISAGFSFDGEPTGWIAFYTAIVFYISIYLFIPAAIASILVDYLKKKTHLFIIIPNALFALCICWAYFLG